MYADVRQTRAWRALRDRVVAEEPVCWLRIPDVCTHWSQTADHLVPVSVAPELGMSRGNHRGACHACNLWRKDKPVEELPGHAVAPDLLAFFD